MDRRPALAAAPARTVAVSVLVCIVVVSPSAAPALKDVDVEDGPAEHVSLSDELRRRNGAPSRDELVS